jgi:hydrogenase expression/formation protein HypE
MQTHDKIILGHGSGGKLMHELIEKVFLKHFNDPVLLAQGDSAVMPLPEGGLAFTTDAYVVQPLFFAGGNIGKIAVCGTINDLVASGAQPLYMSVAFIIEEGLEFSILEIIVKTMAETARDAGVRIVCGDTKVVGKGQCDKLFITTSGVGQIREEHKEIATGKYVQPGDHIIISGTLGDHGMAVLTARNQLGFTSDLQSDCAPLNLMIQPLLDAGLPIHFMRDPTRGGLASVLGEIVQNRLFGIEIDETMIPVSEPVRGMCEVYGFDPLYIANEGKMVIIVPEDISDKTIKLLRKSKQGKSASLIGKIAHEHQGKVVMRTRIGGTRLITMLAGEQLPRIC